MQTYAKNRAYYVNYPDATGSTLGTRVTGELYRLPRAIVLPASRIGELSVFARRRGDMWMLAVMSARLATTLEVPLSFIGDGVHRATHVRDDKSRPDAVQVESGTVSRGEVLKIELAAGGGFVGRFMRP